MITKIIPYLANAPALNWYGGVAFTNLTDQDGFLLCTYCSGATGKVIRSDAVCVPARTIRIFRSPATEICSVKVESEVDIAIEIHLREGDIPKWYDRRLAVPVENASIHISDSAKTVFWPTTNNFPFIYFVGSCNEIQERHMNGLLAIAKNLYLKFGFKVFVRDLNRSGGCPNHPAGTHAGRNADFAYLGRREWDVLFWRCLFDVFTESSMQTHTTIFNEIKALVGAGDTAFLNRISHDTSTQYGHENHCHFNFGGPVAWDKI